MNTYQPYFYIIQNIYNGIYYAGAKWGQEANPKTFMQIGGYTTSSKVINELIRKYSISIFIVRKIRLFNTSEEAYNYETRFLQKIDAKNNPKFYNGHNNDNIVSPEKLKIINRELFGVEYPFMSPSIQEKIRNTVQKKYGVENVSQLEEIKIKKLITRKRTESLMTEEELKNQRLRTNSKIAEAYRKKSAEEKQLIAKKISETKANTPEDIKKERIERMKKNQNREEMARKQRKTLAEREPKTCPHCNLSTKNYSNYARWHGDKCKHKK